MKKLVIILGAVIILFGGLVYLSSLTTVKLSEESFISPEKLKQDIESSRTNVVYFYSKDCGYCQQTTPIIVPMIEEMGIDIKVMDVDKYQSSWKDYSLEGTPTLIHFLDGEEISRSVGLKTKEEFKQWFESTKQ